MTEPFFPRLVFGRLVVIAIIHASCDLSSSRTCERSRKWLCRICHFTLCIHFCWNSIVVNLHKRCINILCIQYWHRASRKKITTLEDFIVFNRFCDGFYIFVLRRFSDKIEHLCHHWQQHPILSRRFCLVLAGNAIESSANTGDGKNLSKSAPSRMYSIGWPSPF